MAGTPDSSAGLPSTGSINQYRQHFSDAQIALIVSLIKRGYGQFGQNQSDSMQRLYMEVDRLKQQLDGKDTQITALQESITELTQYVKRLDASTRDYEERIYKHAASVDQKIAASEASRAVSMGVWDTLLEIVVPIRIAAQWVVKRCLHFEGLGPKRDPLKVKRGERWRDREN